ncbi:MAG: DUF4347 domain-containing protein, partial [Desulfobulbaceae bacterium]|nr:DUF4347 domain-containing protein [Desulfobulbaceae bacterium]
MKLFNSAKHKTQRSQNSRAEMIGVQPSCMMALEPRIMFDGAVAMTAAEVADIADVVDAPDHNLDNMNNNHAEVDFQNLVKDYTPPPTQIHKEIVFVDSTVMDYDQLTQGISSDARVVILDSEADAVSQISAELSKYSNLDAIHIVSHGGPGNLQFGNGSLSLANLDANTDQLTAWGESFSSEADIMLYGCDVAAGENGQTFVSQLAELTGTDVAASTDTTGAVEKGGDWNLETEAGTIETGSAFNQVIQASWQGTLDTATLVSVDSAENLADAATWDTPDATDDGCYVAFASTATNLVTGDTNGWSDIFVRNTEIGDTVRVSIDSSGAQGVSGGSYSPSISHNGRFVAFQSAATNLVAGDTNAKTDIFVHDRDTDNDGIFDEAGAISTTRISVDSAGVEGDNHSYKPSISDDGRYVAFYSDATNLVAGDTNVVSDVFVHDRDADNDGIFDEAGGISTVRASLHSDGSQATGNSYAPSISGDGRHVVFASSATDLITGDTNANTDTFIHDRDVDNDGTYDEAGFIATNKVSIASDGTQGNSYSGTSPKISEDGRFVVFDSASTNLVAGDTNATNDVFVHDRDADYDGIYDEAGAIETKRVSVASDGTQGNGYSSSPNISDGGHYITFTSSATNLVPNDINGTSDAFIHDNFAEGTTLASDDLSAVVSGGVVIAGDGRHLVLSTDASLVGADTNGFNDIYIIDRNDAPTVNTAGKAVINSIMENDTTSIGTAVGDIV